MVRFEFTYTPGDLQEILSGKTPRQLRRFRIRRGLVAWFFFLFLSIALFLAMDRQHPSVAAPSPSPSAGKDSLTDILIPALPFLAIFVFGFALFRRHLQKAGFTVWTSNPSLQLPQVMEFGDDGVHESHTTSDTHWQWKAFNGWSETANFLILFLANQGRVGIPKRAAADPAMLDELRALFQSNITPMIRGFPVSPISKL